MHMLPAPDQNLTLEQALSALTSLTFGPNIFMIDEGAFMRAKLNALKQLDLGSVTTLGKMAFLDTHMPALESLKCHNVKNVGMLAFVLGAPRWQS